MPWSGRITGGGPRAVMLSFIELLNVIFGFLLRFQQCLVEAIDWRNILFSGMRVLSVIQSKNNNDITVTTAFPAIDRHRILGAGKVSALLTDRHLSKDDPTS